MPSELPGVRLGVNRARPMAITSDRADFIAGQFAIVSNRPARGKRMRWRDFMAGLGR